MQLQELFLTAKQAANLTGFTVEGLRKWRREKRGPRYYKVGRRVLYDKADLVEFITRHPVSNKRGQS